MPDASWTDLISLAVAVVAAGSIAGLLAGLFGIGGGAVLVPVFYQVLGIAGVDAGIRMHLAVGTSLAIIVPTSIRSFLSHRAKGAVDMELLKSFVIAVPSGVLLATLVVASISGRELRMVFAVFAILVSLRLLFNRESWKIGDDLPAGPGRFAVGINCRHQPDAPAQCRQGGQVRGSGDTSAAYEGNRNRVHKCLPMNSLHR